VVLTKILICSGHIFMEDISFIIYGTILAGFFWLFIPVLLVILQG